MYYKEGILESMFDMFIEFGELSWLINLFSLFEEV